MQLQFWRVRRQGGGTATRRNQSSTARAMHGRTGTEVALHWIAVKQSRALHTCMHACMVPRAVRPPGRPTPILVTLPFCAPARRDVRRCRALAASAARTYSYASLLCSLSSRVGIAQAGCVLDLAWAA
jgi:hypothetical protein